MGNYLKGILALGVTVGLMGCVVHEPMAHAPEYLPTLPDVASEPQPTNGSLYADNNSLQLYQDIKAHRVGDIITVKLVESTQASKNAQTNLKKESDAETTVPNVLGVAPSISRTVPILDRVLNRAGASRTLDMDVEHETEFKGSGNSNQKNSLSGEITVTVAQVLSNKYLVIRGEKWITLNRGSEFIRLSGIVRPEDIGPNNEVMSSRIANASITYSGTGDVANTNIPGWLSRFFNSQYWIF